MIIAFQDKYNKIINDLLEIRKVLNHNKNTKINTVDANQQLKNINFKLSILRKDARDKYIYYKDFLIKIAKKCDLLNTEIAKNIYSKCSQEIIDNQIKYYIKCEKSFIIYNDIIIHYKNLLNINYNNNNI